MNINTNPDLFIVGYLGIYPVALNIKDETLLCKGQQVPYFEMERIITDSVDRQSIDNREDFMYSKIDDMNVSIGCLTTTIENVQNIYKECKKVLRKNKNLVDSE